VQIPLDYYRILGLPIQATPERLQQAHRDRLQQPTRREYSETATRSRAALIGEAFATLSDPSLRERYDTKFLDSTLPGASKIGESDNPDPNPPTLEIDDANFVGALLILLELGEYETVLKLGRPRLSQPQSIRDSASQTVQRADIVLAVATAYLEIGREQWQKKFYEKAAASLEAGQAMLLREGLLPQLRGEMQADLRKLRPYRVLELLSLPLDRDVPRQRGFQLLRDMLQERGGIDGSGDDRSGLGVEGFLRFAQQLRQYATVAEQQLLFEMEARRPSAVATYLAAYAAIARGFVQHQPASVYRAKSMLVQLGRRQDVHLEQAICSLLLGQSDRATRSLDLSQDEEALAFIRNNSQGSPDLLPGLCLYSERWLQNDIFPHFRDLKDRAASLKDYFADAQVQTYLENLPPDTQVSDRWMEVGYRQLPTLQPDTRSARSPAVAIATATAAPLSASAAPPLAPPASEPLTDPAAEPVSWTIERSVDTPPATAAAAPLLPPPIERPSRAVAPRQRPRRPSKLRVDRVILVGAGTLFALLLLFWLLGRIFAGLASALGGFGAPQVEGTPISIALERPVFELPAPSQVDTARPDRGQLDERRAQAAIEQWLEVKRRAMGRERDIAALSTILTAPALSGLENLAADAEADGWYWQYDHEVRDVSIESAPETDTTESEAASDTPSDSTTDSTPDSTSEAPSDSPGAAAGETEPAISTVVATVVERGTLFEGDTEVRTIDDTLRVRYELERQDDGWYIRDWQAEASL